MEVYISMYFSSKKTLLLILVIGLLLFSRFTKWGRWTCTRRGDSRKRTTCWPGKQQLLKMSLKRWKWIWPKKLYLIGILIWRSTSLMTIHHGSVDLFLSPSMSLLSLNRLLESTILSFTLTTIGISAVITSPSMRLWKNWICSSLLNLFLCSVGSFTLPKPWGVDGLQY